MCVCALALVREGKPPEKETKRKEKEKHLPNRDEKKSFILRGMMDDVNEGRRRRRDLMCACVCVCARNTKLKLRKL